MSEELKEKVLMSRINKAGERLSKNKVLQSLTGEAHFREELHQLKPEFEGAYDELSKMYNHKKWEVMKKMRALGVLVFIAKIVFGVLTLVELFYISEYDSSLPIVLAIAFGTLTLLLWFVGSVISRYNEKFDIIETGIDINEMEQMGNK